MFWWRWVDTIQITVPWPKGYVLLPGHPPGSNGFLESADPNDHFRPWLEQHVGTQYIDWNWSSSQHLLSIQFRKKHKCLATIFKLTYS